MRTARTVCCRLIQDTDLSEHLRTALFREENVQSRSSLLSTVAWAAHAVVAGVRVLAL